MPPIIKFAEGGESIAIENCPMLFLPGSVVRWAQHRFFTRQLAQDVRIIDSANWTELDPSTLSGADALCQTHLRFKDKIFHIHFKDTKPTMIVWNDVGIMGYPMHYMIAKIPGHGQVD